LQFSGARKNGEEIAVSAEADPMTNVTPAAAGGRSHRQSFFVRHKILPIAGSVIVVAIAAGFLLGRLGMISGKNQNRLTLYGNVDLRQIDLAFNDSERLAEVLGPGRCQGHARTGPRAPGHEPAQPASRERRGDGRGATGGRRQAPSRQPPAGDRAGQANVASAKADQVNARQQLDAADGADDAHDRPGDQRAGSRSRESALDSAQARLEVAEKALECP
jgi:HlyD family secretion protein